MHSARCDRAHLYAHPERELSDAEWVQYGRFLKERLQGKPTQYITGHQEFWGMDFLVNPAVLIPRSETELAVEAALNLARRKFAGSKGYSIADVGTGSGCIAVALSVELPEARIYALDRSAAALDTARRNAARLGVESRITFLLSDLLRDCSGEASELDREQENISPPRGGDFMNCWPEHGLQGLHMIVSNPPYVSERDRQMLAREVRDFEPREALIAGESGREVYGRLIPQAAQALRAGGYLVLELGYDSQAAVQHLLETEAWDDLRWLPDLAGIVRVVTARRVDPNLAQETAS